MTSEQAAGPTSQGTPRQGNPVASGWVVESGEDVFLALHVPSPDGLNRSGVMAHLTAPAGGPVSVHVDRADQLERGDFAAVRLDASTAGAVRRLLEGLQNEQS